jgi:8-oxo-dGTP pyrophosphatase MutT (NUDIX family)
MYKIKKSYGIICCKKVDNTISLLLVKKQNTYYFYEFLNGGYQKNDDTHLMKLFNNMTYHEKIIIMSMNFSNIWYYAYKKYFDNYLSESTAANNYKYYLKKKTKFENMFLVDGGKRLKNLISKSMNTDTIWEFPKGRKENPDESDINAAIREFKEETNLDEDHYNILWNLPPIIETFTDFGVTYQNIYYYAECCENKNLIIGKNLPLSEVADVKWININQCHLMIFDKDAHHRLIKLFKIIIKKYKNYIKKISI